MKNNKIKILLVLGLLILMSGCGNNNVSIPKGNDVDNKVKDENTPYMYLNYNNKTYYWKYNKSSFNDSGIGLYLSLNKNTSNDLVSNDKSLLSKKAGTGKLLIDDNYIYYSDEDNNFYRNKLDGSSEESLGKLGKIMYRVGDYIYLSDNDSNSFDSGSNVVVYNIKDKSIKDYKKLVLLGIFKDKVYFLDNNKSNSETLVFGYFNGGEEHSDINVPNVEKYTKSEYNNSYVGTFKVIGDKIYVIYGYADGSLGLIQEAYIASIDADDGVKVIARELTNNEGHVFKDNGKYYINFCGDDNSTYETYNIEDGSKATTNTGACREGVFTSNNTIYYTNDEATAHKIVDIEELKSKYNLKGSYSHINDYEINGNNIYILLHLGDADSSGDIGWRENYKRVSSVVLKYNIESSKLEALYTF